MVYTPAIPEDNKILQWFTQQDYRVIKRAEFLGELTQDTLCLAVAGTHGKTTTSAILGHLLAYCDMPVTAFLGGITENYKSNFISKGTAITVVEADEFDRSFLTLKPHIACITSMDADHLDIYVEHAALEESFQEFANKVSDVLIVAKGSKVSGLSYAINEDADYKISNIIVRNGNYIFDVTTPNNHIKEIVFLLPGKHNMMNALAALAMADCYGIPLKNIKKSLQTFKGVERRFSYKIKSDSLTLIDDYAHHPTEIDAVYESIKEMYPTQKLSLIHI